MYHHIARYRKKDGFSVGFGDGYNYNIIRELTPERINKIRIEQLKNEARILRDKLAIPSEEEDLKKFIAAIKPFTDHLQSQKANKDMRS